LNWAVAPADRAGNFLTVLEINEVIPPSRRCGLRQTMKDGIHPKYQDCTVTCGCGNSFQTRSTKPKIVVEVCSKCHPFYTGTVKFVDAAGRVDKFNKKFLGKYGKAKKETAEAATKS
jgi:large subunit ribosomal protein L31